ncbi:hypothetical protein BJX96DRAFT_112432 [Aspergillus floccosus]
MRLSGSDFVWFSVFVGGGDFMRAWRYGFPFHIILTIFFSLHFFFGCSWARTFMEKSVLAWNAKGSSLPTVRFSVYINLIYLFLFPSDRVYDPGASSGCLFSSFQCYV